MTEPKRSGALARKLARSLPPMRRALKQLAGAERQIAELKQHVAELSTWTPADGDAAEPASAPLGYLFVVTYGRSGSTLVQGFLNSIPGYLIRGENRGVLYRLYQYHSALEVARDEFGRTESLTPRDSWYGIDQYAASASIARMRSLVLETLLKPLPETRVVGFKEIRWFYKDWERYLAFVREVFPGARFIINTRDHAAVSQSKWWAKQSEDEVLRMLAGYETQLTAMTELLGPAAYVVRYDDYVADPGVLAGLYEWLGEPFDRASVDAVLQVRHSF